MWFDLLLTFWSSAKVIALLLSRLIMVSLTLPSPNSFRHDFNHSTILDTSLGHILSVHAWQCHYVFHFAFSIIWYSIQHNYTTVFWSTDDYASCMTCICVRCKQLLGMPNWIQKSSMPCKYLSIRLSPYSASSLDSLHISPTLILPLKYPSECLRANTTMTLATACKATLCTVLLPVGFSDTYFPWKYYWGLLKSGSISIWHTKFGQ